MRKRILSFLCVFCLIMLCGCAAGTETGPGSGQNNPTKKEDVVDKDEGSNKTEAKTEETEEIETEEIEVEETEETEETQESSDDGYTPEELCTMAQEYYNRHNGYYPPEADWTEENGLYTIHLYELVDSGDGSMHSATAAWYEVDKYGKGTDTIMGDEIDLTE